MKKLLVVVTIFCCFLSSIAQMPRENLSRESYIERLDSIDAGWYKYFYIYDDQYNMVKMKIKMSGDIVYRDFYYDEQNRLVRVDQPDTNPIYLHRTDYIFDSLGRRSEGLLYTFENGVIIDREKTIYQYNEDNNVSTITSFFYDELADELVEEEKREFLYNDQLDIDELLFYRKSGNQWYLYEKHVSIYDENHNCINVKHYLMDEGEWWCDNEYNYYYDIEMPSCSIAGLDFSFYYMYTINGINKFCQNKLLYSESLDKKSDGQFEKSRTNYYYSTNLGVDETHEELLNIWPNPVDKAIYIETVDLKHIEIFSMDGKSLLTSDGIGHIDVSTLPAGCYLLKAVMKDGRIAIQKFFKL